MKNKTGEYFIELVAAALHGTFVPEKPDSVSFTDVYNLALRHSLDALTYLAVERLENGPSEKLMSMWSERFYKWIITDTEQTEAFAELCTAFDECAVRYIPIKGIVLKNYYLDSAVRSMTDVDILYSHVKQKYIHKLMLASGYEVRSHNAVNYHDTYVKDGHLCVELHRSLLPSNDKLHSYFDQIWKRAKRVGKTDRYEMTAEDEYIYLIAHQAKHFFESGLGVRPVADIYLYRHAHEDKLDMKYVRKILGRAKLSEFEKRISALGDKWFAGVDSKLVCDDIEEFFLSCEPHGSSVNRRIVRTERVINGGTPLSRAKMKYVLMQYFLPFDQMRSEYKVLEKRPYLLPTFWIHRIFAITFFEKNSVKKYLNEAKNSIGASDEKDIELARRVYDLFRGKTE